MSITASDSAQSRPVAFSVEFKLRPKRRQANTGARAQSNSSLWQAPQSRGPLTHGSRTGVRIGATTGCGKGRASRQSVPLLIRALPSDPGRGAFEVRGIEEGSPSGGRARRWAAREVMFLERSASPDGLRRRLERNSLESVRGLRCLLSFRRRLHPRARDCWAGIRRRHLSHAIKALWREGSPGDERHRDGWRI